MYEPVTGCRYLCYGGGPRQWTPVPGCGYLCYGGGPRQWMGIPGCGYLCYGGGPRQWTSIPVLAALCSTCSRFWISLLWWGSQTVDVVDISVMVGVPDSVRACYRL